MHASRQLCWSWQDFDALGSARLYAVLRLRVDVFVVEQRCAYPELDGHDHNALHLLCEQRGRLLGYLRLLPPGEKHPLPALGRVVTDREARGRGLGRALVQRGITKSRECHPGHDLYLSAQAHLADFYAAFGFVRSSAIYDDDGIPHIDMRLPAA